MLSVGKLKEICEHIEKEYGSDCNIVTQFYDHNNPNQLIKGDYILDYGWNDDGTLYLTNIINKENSSK